MKKVFFLLILGYVFLIPESASAAVPDSLIMRGESMSEMLLKTKRSKRDLDYRQVFAFYPVKALSNYIMISYERKVSDKHILKVGAGYVSFEELLTSTNFDFEVKDYSGFRFDLMLKYFVGENNPTFNGVYFSPLISFKNAKFKYNDFNDVFNPGNPDAEFEEGSATSYHLGFAFGYQLPIGNSFNVDFYIGNVLKRSNGDYKAADRLMDQYKNAIGLVSGLTLGFGF